VIDGHGSAPIGVVVLAADVRLAGVEIRGFTTAAVRADNDAALHMTAGASLHDNRTGLVATGSARVDVDGAGATEQAPTRVAASTGSGIEVRGQARVNLAGTLSETTPGDGTLVVRGNAGDGILIEQLLVAQGAAGPLGMTIAGLAVTDNGGSGVHVFGGSALKVRGSYLSRNALHGLHVETDPAFVTGGAGANSGNDIGRIDLGIPGDPGGVTLQDDGAPNGRKGVCLQTTSGKDMNGPLKLQGNVFATSGSAVDCSRIAGALPATGDCSAAGPLGDVGRNPKNDFDVALCAVP